MYKYILLFLFALPVFAVDEFFCDCQTGADANCTVGADTNDGLTHANAKQTLPTAITDFNAMGSGDSVQFCQGGSWITTDQNDLTASPGAAYDLMYMGSYAPNNWTPVTPSVKPLITKVGNTNAAFRFSGADGVTVKDINLTCTGDCTSTVGFNMETANNYVRITNNEVSFFRFNIRGKTWNSNATAAPNNNCWVDNNVMFSALEVGYYGACRYLLLENNTFDLNGTRGTGFDHNVYISSGTDMTIRSNILTRSTPNAGKCEGVSLVAHGILKDILIEGNNISEIEGDANLACYGIAITAGYGGTAEQFDRVIIRGNTISRMATNYIVVDSCVDCIIENNIIGETQAIKRTTFIALSTGAVEDSLNSNVIIRNNSAVIRDNGSITNGIIANVGTGHRVYNNAIYYTGTDNAFNCFNTPPANLAGMDNNVCYYPNASAQWMDGVGSLATWQTANPTLDQNSQNADPGFTSLSDYTPLNANSNIVGSGNSTYYAPTDFNGLTRTPPYTVGAYQFNTDTPSMIIIRRRR